MNEPIPMDYRLTSYEIGAACRVGCLRQIAASHRPSKVGKAATMDRQDGGFWTMHIEGAGCEIAAAKSLDRYWPGSVNTFKDEPDLPCGVEVRGRSRHEYDLLIRPAEAKGDKWFVLVTGVIPNFKVWGWIGTSELNDSWLCDHGGYGPAYFVPKQALRPLKELRYLLSLPDRPTMDDLYPNGG